MLLRCSTKFHHFWKIEWYTGNLLTLECRSRCYLKIFLQQTRQVFNQLLPSLCVCVCVCVCVHTHIHTYTLVSRNAHTKWYQDSKAKDNIHILSREDTALKLCLSWFSRLSSRIVVYRISLEFISIYTLIKVGTGFTATLADVFSEH